MVIVLKDSYQLNSFNLWYPRQMVNEIDLRIESNRRRLIRKFVFFPGIGIIGTAAHFTVLVIFIELVGVHPVISSTLGFVSGAFIYQYMAMGKMFETGYML